eukprot:TRINITY_DN2766_c0_g1_i2.p1 TRINITY_DN2766_c0_g1~~TRINITY_DN2766_c0_g1_i2.p1  ORF type:complete len:542 (+),score=168.79 TRINITY_DN2766_c0_g1_i2:74-1627(+)
MDIALGALKGPGQEPSRSVWLGNIHPDTTESELHSAFQPFGLIEHVKILPAKNCAFVRFIELDAAIRAHSQMFGFTVHGQQVKIGWGKTEGTGAELGGPPPCRNLWLGNINTDVGEEQIRVAFSQFGPIEKIRILPQKNCAFVNFATIEAAIAAKNQMQGVSIGDRPIKINFGKETLRDGIDLSRPYGDDKPRPPPPPPIAPPPKDLADKALIDKMAEFVFKNGIKFEEMLKEKQKENPKFDFLNDDHHYNAYYKLQIWCCRYPGVDPNSYGDEVTYAAVPPPTSSSAAQSKSAAYHVEKVPDPVSAEDFDLTELSHHLDSLTPTRESLKNSKNWIMSRPFKGKDVANFIKNRMMQFRRFDHKLNVIYLLHDVLFHSSRDRAKDQTADLFSEAYKPFMGDILKQAVAKESFENQAKVLKVMKIWYEKKFYPEEILDAWKGAMELVPEPPPEVYQPPPPLDDRDKEKDRKRHRSDREKDRDRDSRDRDGHHRDRDREREHGHRDREREYDRDSKHRRH